MTRPMTEAAKEARRQYNRAWAAAHPDNIKEAKARFWERKAAQIAAQQTQPQEVQSNEE